MKRFLQRLPIRISPFAVAFFLLLLWLEPSGYTLLPLLCALLHELGHILAILLTGRRITCLRLYPFGIELRTEGFGSYGSDLLIHSAGILCDLLCCLFTLPHLEHSAAQLFFTAHLLLALLNLLPVEHLDGGAILSAVLCRFLPLERAHGICKRASFAAVVLLWLFATYLIFFTQENFSLFSMTLYLFACLFLGKNQGRISENK